MNLDAETYEALGYQVVSTWDLCVAVEIDAEYRRERGRRNDKRPKAKRPDLCPGCSKPLKQDLGSRVRHYCNRACERKAKRSDLKCACGKKLAEGQRVWCSERCRKQKPETRAEVNAARNLRRKVFGRSDRKRA